LKYKQASYRTNRSAFYRKRKGTEDQQSTEEKEPLQRVHGSNEGASMGTVQSPPKSDQNRDSGAEEPTGGFGATEPKFFKEDQGRSGNGAANLKEKGKGGVNTD